MNSENNRRTFLSAFLLAGGSAVAFNESYRQVQASQSVAARDPLFEHIQQRLATTIRSARTRGGVLTAEDAFKVGAVWEILQTRLIRRNVPVRNMELGEVEPAAGSTVRQVVKLKQGIETEAGKAIVKYLKEQGLKKVQASIQGDQVRVTSPSKDDLQAAIRTLKAHDFGLELQFGNFRG